MESSAQSMRDMKITAAAQSKAARALAKKTLKATGPSFVIEVRQLITELHNRIEQEGWPESSKLFNRRLGRKPLLSVRFSMTYGYSNYSYADSPSGWRKNGHDIGPCDWIIIENKDISCRPWPEDNFFPISNKLLRKMSLTQRQITLEELRAHLKK